MKPITLASAVLGLTLASNVPAQEHAHPPVAGAQPASTPMPQTSPVPHAVHDHDASVPPAAPHTHPDPAPQDPATATDSAADHAAMGHDAAPAPTSESDHAAMGHAPVPAATEVDHATMGHGTAPHSTPDVDHSAMGHGVAPAAEVDHSAMGHGAPPVPPRITPVPAPTPAERAAAIRPAGGHVMDEHTRHTLVVVDRLEAFEVDGESALEWELEAWAGGDLHKLRLRSEGEQVGDDLEDADLEVLYGRSIAPWWDMVAGVRHHFEPGQAQDMAVFGVMGLAPYKIETEASLYVGESGYYGARLELEYEALLTNRLILQPALEVNVHGQDDRAHGNGQGLGMVEAGLRLRYEVTRRFAPYVGLVHQRAFGRTADFRREAGEHAEDTRVVVGLRAWF